MIRIEVGQHAATIYGPFPLEFMKTVARCSGRKAYAGQKHMKIESSPSNIKILRESGHQIEWIDSQGVLRGIVQLEMMPTQHMVAPYDKNDYEPKMPLRLHQSSALNQCIDRKAFALLLEMGLGKTAIAIAKAGIHFNRKQITGLFIVAPKGVHEQWVTEEIPKHLDKNIKTYTTLWDLHEKYTELDFKRQGSLCIFSMNIDSIRSEKGQRAAHMFLNSHRGSSMMVVDESHQIKEYASTRTRDAISLGKLAAYRMIMTGTPIGKSLYDMWAQFMFLDPKIIGIYHASEFKTQYAIMGGFSNQEIVDSKNIEQFYTVIAPHSFRMTKVEALDLPPKVYIKRLYELDKASRKHYENIKHAAMTQLTDGTIVAPPNALAMMVRMQQICSGFLPGAEGKLETFSSGRTVPMMDIVEQSAGPIIIWARFIDDIQVIKAALDKYEPDQVATIQEKSLFKAGKKRFFVCNPSSGGTGENLQNTGCQTMIFYNNTHKSIERWQAEDRVHRMGMKGTLTIYDIIANQTVDRGILQVLKDNKDLSDLALDVIRMMIQEN